jgi:hypothetical protein
LEQILAEKMKLIDGNEKKRMRSDDEIKELKNVIDEERRKSMVDEGKIKDLEATLARKVKEANEANKHMKQL